MLERVLRFSIEHRTLVVLAVLAAAVLGASALAQLPIDAVPDITNRQVQINAVAPSLSPGEVEKQVTFPLETALAGIPGLDHTRSFSRNGFSQVTAVFNDDVDIYFARQQVGERLGGAKDVLPPDVETTMGPISTGLGEVYMWSVSYEHPRGRGAPVRDGRPGWQSDGSYLTPDGERLQSDVELSAYLRTVQDWLIRPQLKGLPGVAAVDAIGGFVKQYHVEPDPQELAAYALTYQDLAQALERNNVSTGGGYIEHNGESFIVRAAGRLTSVSDIRGVVVGARGGVPIRLKDVASVHIGKESRTGTASSNGTEVVIGTAFMLVGANSRTVAAGVDKKLAEVNHTLPPDIHATPVLNRMSLVDAAIHTVERNLVEGALLVVVVLFLMLGNIRAALITALAIPLSLLLTAIGMVETRTSGNLMSLGAIDFGLIVDGAIIIVENCLRRLAERQRELGRILTRDERLEVVFLASKQVRTATAFGEAIIITVYIPVLTLTGVEGKMFQPMALTVICALVAAFLLSLTFIPAMVALFITGRVRERENRLVSTARSLYEPALREALRFSPAVILIASLLFVGSLVLFRSLGQEFVPALRELDIMVRPYRIPSTSLSESTAMQLALERRLRELPEVATVFSRTGTAELAADPMPAYTADTFVILKPRDEWPEPTETKADVERRIRAAVAELPGQVFEITQPIEERFNELIAGARSDVAVKVFGDEFSTMRPVADRIGRILRTVPGAVDTRVEQVEGAPVLSIDVDRQALARYGLTVSDVHEVAAIATRGRTVGQVFEGDRRFDLVLRLPEQFSQDPLALERVLIPLPRVAEQPVAASGGAHNGARLGYLPLGSAARITTTEGPNEVSRDNGKRRIVVQTNVRERDIGSFVEEAQRRIAAELTLPAGTWLSWGGQYENLVKAKARLVRVVPVCFLVILLLLFWTFGAARPAAIVFSGVPLALSGGILALWLRNMPFSISAAVGFIALSGVAVLNGLVMVTFINERVEEGIPFEEAIIGGALARLRPVLMTALVASLGFVPMALATGTGAEVQRPLATVVIGGLTSSTALTLFVLPALYWFFRPREAVATDHPNLSRGESDGV